MAEFPTGRIHKPTHNYVWDVGTLAWVTAIQGGGGAGGDASAANQILGNASLTSIDGKTPALGQALAAVSTPVVLTALQLTALTPPAAITGFALETGGNLAAIKTDVDKIPSQGQALAAASLPVVLTAAQVTTLTPPAAITGFATETTLAGRLKPADTLAGVTTLTSITNPVTVTPPTLTKGTQGATGFSTQDLKDAGRVTIMWTAEFAFAQTAETLLTVTESRDGAATTTFTTKVVTSGKRLRITSVALEAETLGTGTTVPQRAYLRIRFNTAGAATASSALQGVWGVAAEPPAILKTMSMGGYWAFPDGIEFLGDGTKQIGFTLETPDWVITTQTGRAKITMTAFEY